MDPFWHFGIFSFVKKKTTTNDDMSEISEYQNAKSVNMTNVEMFFHEILKDGKQIKHFRNVKMSKCQKCQNVKMSKWYSLNLIEW